MATERLQKLISTAGVASRRHAEELITSGLVSVNGKVVTELGTKADPEQDHIKVRGKLINPLLKEREKIYILLNKPKGFLTSVSDDRDRPVVLDLLPRTIGAVHPVGRLDFNTEGLLLLTNDGDFTNFVTAARNKIEKAYEVKVKGIPPEEAIERLRRGIVLEDDTRTAPAKITPLRKTEHNSWFEVILHQGRNQQIRRMFDLIGYSVVKLKRVRIGFLQEGGLQTGHWRYLKPAEVTRLLERKSPSPSSFAARRKKRKSKAKKAFASHG